MLAGSAGCPVEAPARVPDSADAGVDGVVTTALAAGFGAAAASDAGGGAEGSLAFVSGFAVAEGCWDADCD